MAERVARAAIEAFMARDVDGILELADEEIVVRSLLTEAERPIYHDHAGVRVRDAKIVFFGFFRTESDALEAVT